MVATSRPQAASTVAQSVVFDLLAGSERRDRRREKVLEGKREREMVATGMSVGSLGATSSVDEVALTAAVFDGGRRCLQAVRPRDGGACVFSRVLFRGRVRVLCGCAF